MEPELREDTGLEKQQGQPPQQNGGQQPNSKGFVYTIAALVAGVSIVLWNVADDFGGFGKVIIHWLSSCGLLFDVAFLGADKSKSRMGLVTTIWIGYGVVCIGMLIHDTGVFESQPTGQTSTVKPAPPVIVAVPQPDYIEGTTFTHNLLSKYFPFGYAVIYLSSDPKEKKRIVCQDPRSGTLNWNIDWDSVRIEPDFAAGVASWFVPQMSLDNFTGVVHLHSNTTKMYTPLANGKFRRLIGMRFANQPSPYIGCLSADQKAPVFAIGFRIAPKDEP